MEHLIIPENYSSALNLHDTQIGIKTVKDFFQSLLVGAFKPSACLCSVIRRSRFRHER